ncbi:MAG TPA: SMP-30/gluconolactonase/LRE family protein [Vicinamibacterales bacterium]|nr:SMP-30/gluconolactonase/LRE family protein [Vicinamibacterales bacterium]
MRLILRSLFVAALVAAAGATLAASKPIFWQTATLNDFLRGEVENLSIDGHGRLVLGPATELVAETTSPFLWAMAVAPDGSLYVGSGNEGKVFKVEPEGKTTTFFDATELEVHALALANDGTLYAATSPDGRIYKIDRSGKSTTFFDPGDKYIWSLALDKSGNLYAGTGEKGLIYKITQDGKGTTFYQTKATHVITLTFEPGGQLLAGTEGPGRLFRVDTTGKAFLLLDSTFQEIRSIRIDPEGNIYLAALSGRTSGSGQPAMAPPSEISPASGGRDPIPTVTTEITAIAIVDSGGAAAGSNETPAREERRGGRGAIYRIRPDGLWDILWESSEDSPYDLVFGAPGTLVVGTGRSGKLYSLSGNPTTATLLMQASAQQVTGFARDTKGNTYYATSNPGKVFKLSPQRAVEGSYTSLVRDAQTVADWGSLSWRAVVPSGSRVDVFTRSGNTATPDDTWSAWSGPYTTAQGEEIKSPNARYLQWKAVLTGKQASPVLTSVSAAYVQRNLRPKLTSLTVHPAGTVFQKPYPTGDPDIAGFDDQAPDRRILSASSNPGSNSSSLGRRAYQRGLQTFVWRAEDANEDELRYAILYRREGDTAWKSLKDDLADAIFVWDTTSVPNGTYVIKVVASDQESNPPGAALEGELESSAFDIDNAPPAVVVTGSRPANSRTTIQFEVRDEWSSISKVEYSLDAQAWQVVYPRDGIFDSRIEQFELTLDNETAARGLIIRAYDAKNNSTTARGDVPPR